MVEKHKININWSCGITTHKHETKDDAEHCVFTRNLGFSHRTLLIKYLARIIDCEGVNFIRHTGPSTGGIFTDQEVQELEALVRQAKIQYGI